MCFKVNYTVRFSGCGGRVTIVIPGIPGEVSNDELLSSLLRMTNTKSFSLEEVILLLLVGINLVTAF